MPEIEYSKICFVIMPFNKKKVGDVEVDFDHIYQTVFKPAIESVELPEGGKLLSRRADDDYFTGDIGQEMFQYIEYSRFALADISGSNANVFYELGVRQRAHESGTAIFRQETGAPPFDIAQIKAFPYHYEPETKVSESIKLITKVLTESLIYNRLDSPPMRALLVQRAQEEQPHHPNIEPLLIEADNALRVKDWATAINKFGEAIAANSDNTSVLMKRGLVYRDRGKFAEALADFTRVTELSPQYAEAYRERGIAENKIYNAKKKDERPLEMPNGEKSLRRAVELKPDDFDALSSLGGVYKRQERWAEAAQAYHQATDISQGNTYPLLNELTIQARADGVFALDEDREFMLERARQSLKAQVESGYNAPWSAFDLAQVCLYTNDAEGFQQNAKRGLLACTHKWQPRTFRETLELLTVAHITLPGLEEGIEKLKKREALLPD